MIVNPVVFGKSGAKTVEVTITGNSTIYCYVDRNGEYYQEAVNSSSGKVLEMIAGSMFAVSIADRVQSGATYVGAISSSRGPFFWKVNDA